MLLSKYAKDIAYITVITGLVGWRMWDSVHPVQLPSIQPVPTIKVKDAVLPIMMSGLYTFSGSVFVYHLYNLFLECYQSWTQPHHNSWTPTLRVVMLSPVYGIVVWYCTDRALKTFISIKT